MSALPSDDVARLREELAREEAELIALESDVESKAAQLSYLHTEYTLNKMRLRHHYEPRLEPLRIITCAAAEKESLLVLQIEWLERYVVEQERRSQDSVFIEARDMKPAAEEYLKKAEQVLLRCYEHITECPEDALRMISQYACPPDEAIATMQLVMRVRGEPPEECTWGAAQVLLSYNYFHEFFVTRSESLRKQCDLLDDALMNELELFCANPHHAVDALYQVSIPIGCMGEWLRAIRDYYRVKLVTAPVLLRRDANLRKETERAQAWLKAVTLGNWDAPKSRLLSIKTATITAPPTQAKEDEGPATDSTTADKAIETELDVEEREALASYAAVKQSLQHFRPSTVATTDFVMQLRHRLHRLRESVRAAEEKREETEREMEERLEEVRGNYDGTMVPLEDQLEGTTETFAQRITCKRSGSPALASNAIASEQPAAIAASNASEGIVDAACA
ncbi:hypothetical protein ABL78_4713 [Leptomonas seymouri]|uniref:Uncharacterized protein n=1 Tax=Leptomonas seymouri TaxID=5684 RepID=A0A0N1IK09_LEPSE|nr:hypothetical protein ABL78_4713 [Leptomonas seymouri]|eukprot:KPI86240.1 hypothetical protein ABL78_4713 [Leptomonas seymouri]